MKLKKLILSGFKSFADRTEFVFDEGISCVVGPNGCGKSNVVDAVKWVLGEQSAKSLRGSEMLDVIFNGSSVRRAAGGAEVTLVFDNADGLLRPNLPDQTDTNADVAVTRRLFRSGQSEYLINKTTCRLRDIREMFMDTGVGVHAYGVIEQGHVEVFLQASHEDRRAVFDEAAGISKYKARRKEATRKLERVEQNLLRLTDVLAEVQRRLRSIKYQAGKARSYQTCTQRLRELKSLHFLSQYHQLSRQRQELQQELDRSSDALAAVNTRIDQLNASHSAASAEVESLEMSARDLRVQIATIGGQITTCQERADANAARVEELAQRAVVLAARCEEMEAKAASIEEDLARRSEQLRETEKLSADLSARYESQREAQRGAEVGISRLEADLEDEKNGTMDLIRRAAQLHNEVQASAIRQDSLNGRRDRLHERSEELAGGIGQLLTERAQMEAKRDDLQEALAATKDRLEQANQLNRSAIEDEHGLQENLSAAREQRSALASRAHALQEMQQRREGLGAGARHVLEARRAGRLGCIRGILGDFLQADVEHAPLIEAALGGADQQLIAMTLAEVTAAADEMAEALGKNAAAEVWCLDRLEPLGDDFDAARVDGFVARAIEWVRFDPWIAPAAWRMLGKTLVVESLDHAKAAAEIAPRGYRFVTTRGEVLEADGRVRFGSANRAAGVVTRRSELIDLEGRISKLDAEIEDLASRCRTARGRCEHAEQVVHGLRTSVYEDSMELTACTGRLEQIDDQIAELKREQPIVAGDLQHLAEEIERAVRAEHEAREKAAELEELQRQRQQRAAELEQEISAARSSLAERSEQMTELKVSLGEAREKAAALKETISSIGRQQDQMARDLQSARSEMGLNRQQREEAEAAVADARRRIEELYSRHESLTRDSEDMEETRGGLRDKIDEIDRALAEQRKTHNEASERLNACRVDISKADADIANLISRASDDMGMDLVELIKDYSHDEERDWAAVADEVRQLDEKIKRLGNVNLDAIAEQDELEAREALFEGQIKDVQDSHRRLNELIRRINKESRQRFSDTFDEVRENFQGLFRKLFGGGRADILLTNPDDVLESGIEILARPPGKDLRSLSLLSGGEKTMTALALLFSIFKSRPSPFCLLDEVDAALDEANTERFSRLVQEFVESSQFVIISHAKRTMSMANVLYGVTMQEPGVSKRISVRFEQADKMLEEDLQPVGA